MSIVDEIIALSKLPKLFGVSKSTLWSKGGILSQLPIIHLSERRRGVRKSDLEAWLVSRTRQPKATGH